MWLSSLFMNTAWLSSQQNLEDFVRAFENATIPKSQWDHRAHIVVAAYYAEQYGLASTLEKLRTGISVLNSKHGIDNTATSGYTRDDHGVLGGCNRDISLSSCSYTSVPGES